MHKCVPACKCRTSILEKRKHYIGDHWAWSGMEWVVRALPLDYQGETPPILDTLNTIQISLKSPIARPPNSRRPNRRNDQASKNVRCLTYKQHQSQTGLIAKCSRMPRNFVQNCGLFTCALYHRTWRSRKGSSINFY